VTPKLRGAEAVAELGRGEGGQRDRLTVPKPGASDVTGALGMFTAGHRLAVTAAHVVLVVRGDPLRVVPISPVCATSSMPLMSAPRSYRRATKPKTPVP
jgi:hypothetical protein